MSEFELDFEWEDPQGARGPELRATWARWVIRIQDVSITQVHDCRTNSVREGIYLPLYPVAEWIALHWWHLLYEVEPSSGVRQGTYARRHGLRSTAEGFALPDVTFVPIGAAVHVRWEDGDLPICGVRFLQRGEHYFPLSLFRGQLEHLVEAVIARLASARIMDTLLQKEWRSIQEADREEQEFCQVAAALGLDPYDLDNGTGSTLAP